MQIRLHKNARSFDLLMAKPVSTTVEQFGSFMNAEHVRNQETVKRSEVAAVD